MCCFTLSFTCQNIRWYLQCNREGGSCSVLSLRIGLNSRIFHWFVLNCFQSKRNQTLCQLCKKLWKNTSISQIWLNWPPLHSGSENNSNHFFALLKSVYFDKFTTLVLQARNLNKLLRVASIMNGSSDRHIIFVLHFLYGPRNWS